MGQELRGERKSPRRHASLWDLISGIAWISLAVLLFTHGSAYNSLWSHHQTVVLLGMWGVGMMSFRQDAERHGLGWAVLSQFLAGVAVIALIVFGFKSRFWPNFLAAALLAWLQMQFTKRWWARPGAWW
jgi:hypothetical protein